MNALRELLACFDSDDLGDAILLVISIVGVTAMLAGWL